MKSRSRTVLDVFALAVVAAGASTTVSNRQQLATGCQLGAEINDFLRALLT
jgi:hypothetical protein